MSDLESQLPSDNATWEQLDAGDKQALAAVTTSSKPSLASAIDDFAKQNLTPTGIMRAAQSLATGNVRGALASAVPILGKFLGGPAELSRSGEWQSALYAADLNKHHAKFKFLFKVKFEGFGTEHFYNFVHRCDKPRVRFEHQDVNYYNFRTRVLTKAVYEPLSMSFLDETGDTVNQFFSNYMRDRSGVANGAYGIHTGFGVSSSTKPYKNGHADGKKIIIEQIFYGGTKTNRFTFINPRIESFDFDELNMEDSNGNMVNITFTYDAFTSETLENTTSYSWGQTDLLKGGGTSGPTNAYSDTGATGQTPVSATGEGIGVVNNATTIQPNIFQKAVAAGQEMIGKVGTSMSTILGRPAFNQPGVVDSSATTLQGDISTTLNSVYNGDNLKFGGGPKGPTGLFGLPVYDPGDTKWSIAAGEAMQKYADNLKVGK